MNVEARINQIMPILESVNQFSREERVKFIMSLCEDVFRVAYTESQEMGPMAMISMEHRIKENGIKTEQI